MDLKKKSTKSLSPKRGNVSIFSKNHSVVFLRKYFRDVTYKKPVLISHGSRTEACLKRVTEIQKIGGVIINHPSAIAKCSNKYTSKDILKKLKCSTTDYQEATDKEIIINYPIVAKLKVGFGGKGMELIETQEQMKEFCKGKTQVQLKEYFFEEMFNPRKTFENHVKTTREYRIAYSPWLVGHNISYFSKSALDNNLGVIVILKKCYTDQKDPKFGKNITSGNAYFSKEFALTAEEKELIFKCLSDIHKYMSFIELDYAAIDVLICPEKKTYNIIEFNTAPGFSETEENYTLERYRIGLDMIIQQKIKSTTPIICAE